MKEIVKPLGVIYYTFDNLSRVGGIKHCFTSKHGGISEGCFASMNLGYNRGDSDDDVLMNYIRLCGAMDISINNLVFSDQVHGTKILQVNKNDRGKGIFYDRDYSDIDGLMTNERDVVLTTFYADCVPLYFYDKKNHAIALSHAGWKGTLAKIAMHTIVEMKLKYGTKAQDLIIGIGPSIGSCCYEVDNDVAARFIKELPLSEPYIVKRKDKKEKYMIDLWSINRQIMINIGVKPENIELSSLCTKCNSDKFFSHREMGKDRGSMAALISLL